MKIFNYKNDELFCENVEIGDVCKEFNTPAYIYSKNLILHKYNEYDKAFSKVPHTICYALKANSNMKILKLLKSLGGGADVVSGGELYLALKAGFKPEKIVYAGVGKTNEEIEYALKNKICAFNVESQQELNVINEIAQNMGLKAPVAVRINPDIDIHGHPYISTGKYKNKFGVDIDSSIELIKQASSMAGIKIVGIHTHIGSQILNVEYFTASAKKLYSIITELKNNGINIEHIDIGGGLGANYNSVIPEFAEQETNIPNPADLAKTVIEILKPAKCEIFLEPGRSIVGEAGILVTKVLYTKQTQGKDFVVVDAGMNDLIRPSLYQAYHQIAPLTKVNETKNVVDVVGPICETGDFIAKDRELPEVKRGDYLAIMTAGAYGYSLASNYNSRPKPVEILIDNDKFEVIREREKIENL